MSFVHLHCHSSYSLLDGAQTPASIVARAKALGQPAVALTDHGNMHGVMRLWDAAKKAGIMPIIGMEAYIAPESRHHKEPIEDIPPQFHLTLHAMNEQGLHNLYVLTSKAHTEGFYHRPRIDYELLEQYNEGLVCLSGCLKGHIQYLLQKQIEHPEYPSVFWFDQATRHTYKLQGIFGDRFFMELQRILPVQNEIIKLQMMLCRAGGIRPVATCDAHYSTAEDSYFHEQIVCLNTGKTILDADKLGRFEGLYLKSTEEMQQLFQDIPEAVSNTLVVADMCKELSTKEPFKANSYIFPVFTQSEAEDIASFEQATRLGLERRGLADRKDYQERLEYEIQTIKDMGFASYFLVVSDYCQWARRKGIGVGPGRGSAAGALVAFCLEITDVDPLEYGLLFQRFLNKGRKSMPDIDSDFCMNRRSEVMEYITQRYGLNRVAHVATFAEFKPRGACRDFCRVQGEEYALGEEASKLIPPMVRGREPTWEESLKSSPVLLKDHFKNIINMARKSEGMVKQRGVHAGGLVISREDFVNCAPTHLGKNKEIVSQWDKDDLERIGLVKMDILGLTALTVISTTLRLIQETLEEEVILTDIPKDNEATFDMIAAGDTSGVFQLDAGGGMRELCVKLKPRSIQEIAAILALYRPGPLDSGMMEDYIQRVNDPSKVTYLVPELEPILKETYGLMIYQEQAMRIATDLAGYSLEDADDLRKAIGKKLPEKMAKEEQRIITGMTSRGISADDAQTIWQNIKVFADYGFNKSHAVAYAFVTFYTAYLKANYKTQFYCALLSQHMGEREKLMEYLGECRKVEIQVLPPDVNQSNIGFTIVDGIIRFGLAAIREVGEKVSQAIIDNRRAQGRFEDLFDFYKKVKGTGVNKRTIEALAKAGALDSLGIGRAAVLAIVEQLVGFDKEVEKYDKKMETFNKRTVAWRQREEERAATISEGKKPRNALTKPDMPSHPVPLVIPDIEEFQPDELLNLEKEMIGVYISGHPLYEYERDMMKRATAHTASLMDYKPNDEVTLLGIIAQTKEFATKKGNKMGTIVLEDLHGNIEIVIFPATYEKCSEILKEGNVVVVTGRTEGDDEKITRIIAFGVELLPKRVKYRAPKPPKQVAFTITSITPDLIDQVKRVVELCPGEIKVNIRLNLGGYYYKLHNVQSMSFDGVRKLAEILNQPLK